MNKLAIKLIRKTIDALDTTSKLGWLDDNCDVNLGSGYNYLPKFFLFAYTETERLDSDYTKYVAVKVSFGNSESQVTNIEYFDGVQDYISFAAQNCNVDHIDLNCSELDVVFSYAKQFSLDTICRDIEYYEVDVEDNEDDVHFITESIDGYFQEVDEDEYKESQRQAGIIKRK